MEYADGRKETDTNGDPAVFTTVYTLLKSMQIGVNTGIKDANLDFTSIKEPVTPAKFSPKVQPS